MKMIELLEHNKNAREYILSTIDIFRKKFGEDSLYGGNCGTFALSLADYFRKYKPTLGILFRENHDDINDIKSLIEAETDIYHIVFMLDGVMYDGTGICTTDDLLDIAQSQYGDEFPGFFTEVDPFDKWTSILINNDTNFSITASTFCKFIKTYRGLDSV